jgi:hypothetical protein
MLNRSLYRESGPDGKGDLVIRLPISSSRSGHPRIPDVIARCEPLSEDDHAEMEVTIASEKVILVPRYTEQQRAELSYQDAHAIADMLMVFPEAEVRELRLVRGRGAG